MKRLMSFVLILVMLCSLSITAFAEDGSGSITITNATIGKEYKVYYVMEASYYESTGATRYNAYPEGDQYGTQFYDDIKAKREFFNITDNTGVENAYSVTFKSEKTAEIFAWLQSPELLSDKTPVETVVAEDTTLVFDDLHYGYYVITSEVGSAVTITTNTPSATVIDKNQQPGWGDASTSGKFVRVKGETEWVRSNSANIGDVLEYKIVAGHLPNYQGAEKIVQYSTRDIAGAGLEMDLKSLKLWMYDVDYVDDETTPNSKIKLNNIWWDADDSVAGKNIPDYPGDGVLSGNCTRETADCIVYDATYGDGVLELIFPWVDGSGNFKYDNAPYTVVATYESMVLTTAKTNANTDNLDNAVTLRWKTEKNATGETGPSTVSTDTYVLGIRKVDGKTQDVLAQAKFKMYADANKTTQIKVIPTGVKGVYMIDNANNRAALGIASNAEMDGVMETFENGRIIIDGLEAGTYWLDEFYAPNGYNQLSGMVEVTLSSNNDSFTLIRDEDGNTYNKLADVPEGKTIIEDDYKLTRVIIENFSGAVLPSTGGEGTFLMITIGTLIAMVAVVFMVTNKKMSVYKD